MTLALGKRHFMSVTTLKSTGRLPTLSKMTIDDAERHFGSTYDAERLRASVSGSDEAPKCGASVSGFGTTLALGKRHFMSETTLPGLRASFRSEMTLAHRKRGGAQRV